MSDSQPCTQVQVRQDKVNPASSSEHPVNIGLNPVSLVEIKLASRQAVKKLRKKKRGAAAAEEDDSGDDDGPDDQGSIFGSESHNLGSVDMLKIIAYS